MNRTTLVEKIKNHLYETNPFSDSDDEFHGRMKALLEDLDIMMEGGRKFTLILRDPIGHSFLQNPYHPENDQRVIRQTGPRTEEEDDILGIADMKV